jgi:hypothetical protein
MEEIKMENSKKKEFIIKICGYAQMSEKTDLDNVETFYAFVNNLFKQYGDSLEQMLNDRGVLSYDVKDEEGKLVDPYLFNFELTKVYKDVQS